jgi:Zn-dependent protease with chaperone function
MNTLVPVVFNLLLNAVGSFVATLGLVALALRIVPIGPGRARLTLWLLPYLKVLWDLAQGIPGRSFVWVHALGAKQELGSFILGVGLGRAHPPIIHAELSSRYAGLTYSQSAADLLYRCLEYKLAPWVPALLVAGLLGTALARLCIHGRSILAFRRATRELLNSASLYLSEQVGLRAVSVYSSPAYGGAPYAAGVVHAHVLFSEASLRALDARAREAAVQHELSHIERHDPLLITCLTLFSNVFWFMPCKDWLMRRVFAEIELCADQRALERGAEAYALADALVSVGEQLDDTPQVAVALSLQKHQLRERVERLLVASETSRRKHVRSWLSQALLILVLVPSVLGSSFFGN